MTVDAGALAHAHVGAVVSLSVPTIPAVGGEPGVMLVTGEVVRVQHNPGETLLMLTTWSGPLDPTHPIETGA